METATFLVRAKGFDVEPQALVGHELRVGQCQVTAEQDDRGTGLGVQVGLGEEDDMQRVCELFVEQVRLGQADLDVPLHVSRDTVCIGRYEGVFGANNGC